MEWVIASTDLDPQRKVPAGRFRRRLTIAFVAVAGLSAATVGLGAYLLVRDHRSDDFVERSLQDAEANHLTITDETEIPTDAELESLSTRFERRGADATIFVTPSGSHSSRPWASLDDVPPDLVAPDAVDADAELPHADLRLQRGRYLVVVAPENRAGLGMYLFYSKAGLEAGLQDLASITWRLWLLVVISAALVGNALARRTLRPVSRASAAARSLAEGLLDTRLPVERGDEFGAWASAFNEMADALQATISQLTEARDRERRFTSDVSHELRTPLTALIGSASLLEERLSEMDDETRWVAERMIAQTRRMRSLVDELLEISRLRAGRETITIAPVDLSRMIESILVTQGWQGQVSFEPRSVVVQSDKARVERVVTNLISNAVVHGKKDPSVSLGVDNGTAIVSVSDRGEGIAAEHLPHLFERFFKADPSRRGGSGLGLAIAAENARLVGGRIDVEAAAGGGASFRLHLPVDGHADAAVERIDT